MDGVITIVFIFAFLIGHTLGTSLFSPPPSSGNQHGLFVNSPNSSGKVVGFSPGTPNHPPVGSGTVLVVPSCAPNHPPGTVLAVPVVLTIHQVLY